MENERSSDASFQGPRVGLPVDETATSMKLGTPMEIDDRATDTDFERTRANNDEANDRRQEEHQDSDAPGKFTVAFHFPVVTLTERQGDTRGVTEGQMQILIDEIRRQGEIIGNTTNEKIAEVNQRIDHHTRFVDSILMVVDQRILELGDLEERFDRFEERAELWNDQLAVKLDVVLEMRKMSFPRGGSASRRTSS